jgi:hypothetical protein
MLPMAPPYPLVIDVDVSGVVDVLLNQSRDPTTLEGYSIIPVHAWSHTFSDVVEYDDHDVAPI